LFKDSVSDPSISASSYVNRDDCVEYDSEGEPDFEEDVKKIDKDVFPVIGTNEYLKFKDKSQIRDDAEVQLYGVDKSAFVAPSLTPTNDSELDTTVTPSSFLPPNETVSIISTIILTKYGNTYEIKSINFQNSEFIVGESSLSSSVQIQENKTNRPRFQILILFQYLISRIVNCTKINLWVQLII